MRKGGPTASGCRRQLGYRAPAARRAVRAPRHLVLRDPGLADPPGMAAMQQMLGARCRGAIARAAAPARRTGGGRRAAGGARPHGTAPPPGPPPGAAKAGGPALAPARGLRSPAPLRRPAGRIGILDRLLLERGLDHRHDRIGQRKAHDAEQGAEDELRAEHQRRRQVDRLARDIGHDQIAVDDLHDDIDSDRPKAGFDIHRKADQDDQRPEMIAPILGRKARMPVSRPSKVAIGTPPIISSNQVPTPSTAIPTSRPAISRRNVKPIRSDVR